MIGLDEPVWWVFCGSEGPGGFFDALGKWHPSTQIVGPFRLKEDAAADVARNGATANCSNDHAIWLCSVRELIVKKGWPYERILCYGRRHGDKLDAVRLAISLREVKPKQKEMA